MNGAALLRHRAAPALLPRLTSPSDSPRGPLPAVDRSVTPFTADEGRSTKATTTGQARLGSVSSRVAGEDEPAFHRACTPTAGAGRQCAASSSGSPAAGAGRQRAASSSESSAAGAGRQRAASSSGSPAAGARRQRTASSSGRSTAGAAPPGGVCAGRADGEPPRGGLAP